MKRNRKYNKKMPIETSMNGLRHIVILLGIGFFSSVLFSQDCTDESACNYNPDATENNGSCVYAEDGYNCEGFPTEFIYNQSTFQAFYYFNPVTMNGAPIESDDWVGAFNGDICVGARKWDTSQCGNGVCDVPVMGDDDEDYTEGYMNTDDIPNFIIYDASEGSYYDASPGNIEPWANNTIFPPTSLSGVGDDYTCNDELACNTGADDACEYSQENYDCDGNCVVEIDCANECGGSSELDACGVCGGDNSSCAGCTDIYAFNYDLDALVNDGSCEYPVYGCTDETALNYDPEATNSNGNCDYPPEVGIWFGNIDADPGSMEIYSSSDSDLDNISFSITGATITDATEGSFANNNFILSGSMNPGSGLLTVLSFTDIVGDGEFCITFGSANAIEYNPVNLTLGGCSVFVGINGGEVASETGGVTIPADALFESENISVGAVTEELPEEVDNATGFEVEELVAFTPFDLVFEVPVEIIVSSTSQSRDGEDLCYLEDANDTEWAVVDGANCTDGTCTADVMEFGIFATCVLVEDCHYDVGGFAYWDDCGVCVGGETVDVANDTMDECGLCDGPGTIEWYEDLDGDNLGYGDGVSWCADEVDEGYVPNDDDTEPYCSTNNSDECDVCGGDGSSCADPCADGGCDCEGTPGGDATEDCAGVCNGDAVLDNGGVCNGDAVLDNCGILNGNDSDCWYIDIEAVVSEETSGATIAQDIENRIGMHSAAEDILNVDIDSTYDCDYCYMDVYEPLEGDNDPDHETMFYFPHPEWNYFLGDDFTQDIRALNTLQNFEDVKVWDAVFKSDLSQSNVTLKFTMINEMILRGAGGFVRVFVLQNNIYTEINNGDDYTFSHWDSDDSLKIVIGMGDSPPRVTVISPNGNEIRSTEDSLIVKLEYEVYEFIDSLKLDLQIMECTDTAFTTKDACELVGNEWSAVSSFTVFDGPPVDEFSISSLIIEDFYNANSNDSDDYLSRFSIHAEIIGLAGGDVSIFPDYQDDSDNTFTISKPESTTEIATGWHLLAPPVKQEQQLNTIFYGDAFGCTLEGCTTITAANSGTGFYTISYGDNSSFTFNGEVLSDFSTNLEPGWNLIGNPLVTSVDINTVIITYNGIEYKWPEASQDGIISPTPIIYDNESGGHIGTELLSSGAGFWLYSYYGDVEISFIPSNPAPEIEPSNYWNLSLFAKEHNAGANSDERIGSEIVIGIHEDANNAIVDGEDQEIFPLSEMYIFDHYSDLSINNDGQTSLYKDIRSFHETSITWDLEGELVQYNSDEGIQFTWEFSGDNDPYNYYLYVGEDIPVNMKDFSWKVVSHNYFLEDMSIIAELKEEYIGCTDPDALNYNRLPNGEYCVDETCLGGNQAEFCENNSSVSLVLPETYTIYQDVLAFELPISLDNPDAIAIEGLQFILEYDAGMIQLNDVTLNENLGVCGEDVETHTTKALCDAGVGDHSDEAEHWEESYYIQQEICTSCIPEELLVIVYYNGTGEMISGEGEILTLSGYGLPTTGTSTINFSSVLINENANAFGNSCEIIMGLAYLSVSGEIIYYKTGLPVSDGFISMTQIDNLSNINSDISNEDGIFIVESLIDDKTYELLLEKDEYGGILDDYFDGLSAVDASRIARHAGNLYNFSTKEKIAANVNFDYRCENENGDPTYNSENECQAPDAWVPNIEAGDAVLVAKYAAGINPHLNQDEDGNEQCDPHWVFINPDLELMFDYETCVDIPYEIELESSISDLVFEGIRLGDVTGNWTAPLGRQNDNNVVENPTIEVEVGQLIKLPIYLPNKAEIEGVDLTIQFDPEVFTLIGFNDNNSILEKSKYPTIINTEKAGLFTLVSYANSTPINDNGLLGNIKFEVIGNSSCWSSISINKMKINDIQEGGFLVEDQFESSSIAYGFDYQISAVPGVFALNKNYPNPFNPNTNIQFELPIDGDIKIFIYDLKGSLIDELMNGYMEAGYHQIKWDGSRQASGMYFVRMIADNGNYIKMTKMMLVK